MNTLIDSPGSSLGRDVWEEGELAIVATPSPSGVPAYQLTSIRRQTPTRVVTVEGVPFHKDSLTEVAGTRSIVPGFAPVFPILRAQLATGEHRRAIAAAFWSFQEAPDKARAQYLAAVVADFLDSTPDTE